MEIALTYFKFHRFINRGFLIGPYLPIYGVGVVVIVIVCDIISKYDDSKGVIFLASFIICGLLEYAVSYFLEKRFHARWWDYSHNPMNLNGRVWIGNLILFGIGGLIVNEIVNPFYKGLISQIPMDIQYVLCIIIFFGMCTDLVFSYIILKFIRHGIENSEADNTEDITNEIRMLLSNKNVLYSRIIEAYPEISYRTDRVKKRLENIKNETERVKDEIEKKKFEAEEKIAELTKSLQTRMKHENAPSLVKAGNVFDYIRWRGDIRLEDSEFNEVDNAILSQLSYVDLEGIIVEDSIDSAKTIEKISDEFFARVDLNEYLSRKSMTKNAVFVLREIAKTVRFKDMKMFSYVNDISETEESQFSAVSIYLGNNSVYVSFSGTDDSIVGWHEDFNMAHLDKVAGQIKAKLYLERIKLAPDTKIYLGGHSKGGNLAISSALDCNNEIKEQIVKVYNNDGPGFSEDVISSDEYVQLIPKIHSIMPSGSIVGALFEHGDQYKYIGSTNFGIKEHDVLSWQVLGNEFCQKDSLSKYIVILDEKIRQWMEGMSNDERKEFVDNLFLVLEMAKIKTIDDFTSENLVNAFIMMIKEKRIRTEYKNRISEILKVLIRLVT